MLFIIGIEILVNENEVYGIVVLVFFIEKYDCFSVVDIFEEILI